MIIALLVQTSDAGKTTRRPVRKRKRNARTRLTVDITPALRRRIKAVACQRGLSVADMLRMLLAREFPNKRGAAL